MKFRKIEKWVFKVVVFVLLLSSLLEADVKSTNGVLNFDVQNDQQPEMVLNSIGLGIGITPSSDLHVAGNTIIKEKLSVGASYGSSNLNVNGTIGFGFQTISEDATLGNDSVVLVDSSSDNITLHLPYAGNVTGRQYKIKRVSNSNTIWVFGGGNLIDDSFYIKWESDTSLQSISVISNNNQWYILQNNGDLFSHVASDNILAWWTFDDFYDSELKDSGPNNIQGQLLNGGSFSGNRVFGPVGYGLNLDGVDDYVYIGGNSITFDTGSTLSIWLTSDVAIGTGPHMNYPGLFSSGINVFDNYISFTDNSGFGFFLEDVDGSVINRPNLFNYTVGDWIHVVMTRPSAGNVSFYVNGNLVGSHVDLNFDEIEMNYIGLGYGGATNDGALQGSISDVMLYDKALSDEEVSELYLQ